MLSIQIRLPEELVAKVDDLIKNGLFRSRSDLLRHALDKYISQVNYTGVLPYIVGPFTQKNIELLKQNPLKSLQVPASKIEELRKELKNIQI